MYIPFFFFSSFSLQTPPYIMKKPKPINGHPLIGNDKYEGYCVDLARKVAHEVGFDYVFQMVKDGAYGSKLPNDSWNGMVGELIRLVRHVELLDLIGFFMQVTPFLYAQ